MSEHPSAPTPLEHPPVPPMAFDAAHNAVDQYSHVLLPAQRLDLAVASAAKVLWREWTRGKAVVSLPEPDEANDCHWTVSRGLVVADADIPAEPAVWLNQADFGLVEARQIAAALLAACHRAEQLAAEAEAGEHQ